MDFPLLEPIKEPPEVSLYRQKDIQLGKVKFHWAQAGKGPTLLLIHGWTNNWQGWIPLSEILKKKYQVIMPDMPGFGDSYSPNKKYTIPMQAYWIGEFIKKKKLKPDAIVGLSMGSFVAAYFCQQYPQFSQNCILVGPVFKSSKNPALSKLLQKTLEFSQNHQKTQSFIHSLVSRRLYAYLVSKYINMYKFNRFLVDSYGLIGKQKMTKEAFIQMGVSAAKMDMEKILAKTRLPKLLVWGQADKLTNPQKAVAILEQAKIDFQWREIPQAGHVVSLEKPRAVAKEIRNFLKA